MKVQEVSEGFDVSRVVPYFQPIMDLTENVVWSYECLARLVTDNERTFLPSEFLYLVEKEQCFGELTQHIFHHCALYFRENSLQWSINISERDIVDPQTTLFLRNYLAQYPHAERVTLELMAKTVLNHPEEFKEFLQSCKNLDIKIFVDHFGEVPSSIGQILEMPIDGVKIDGALLAALACDEERHHLLQDLSEKAKSNDIIVIAEHIEDEATLSAVNSLNIRYAQGFYFSHPQSKVS